jgi:Flp pilus assembly protein TadD
VPRSSPTDSLRPRPRRRARRTATPLVRLYRFWHSLSLRRSHRIGLFWLTTLFVLSAAIIGGIWVVSRTKTRTIRLCAVADSTFRDQKDDWERRVTRWFSEVNRIFQPAGVRWDLALGGDAYPKRTPGDLLQRRKIVEEINTCPADVVLGFTGQADDNANSSVAPFGHVALVAIAADTSDTLAARVTARTLATLFGVKVATQPTGTDGLDPAAMALIRTLSRYEFARGVAKLQGPWERTAMNALELYLAGKDRNPSAQAHRLLGEAFADGQRHASAIVHFRDALGTNPNDASLKYELGVELEADEQTKDAIQVFRDASRLDPNDPRPHAAIGGIFLKSKRLPEALEEWRAAAKLDPQNPRYQAVVAGAEAAQATRGDEAEAAYRLALSSMPRERTGATK